MTDIIDPCNEREIPGSPDPSAPSPTPVEAQTIEIPAAAFPVRQSPAIQQETIRDSAIIEKYLWNGFISQPSRIRMPAFANIVPEWQERPELVDSFRYVAGKNWTFSDGNLTFFNASFEPSVNTGVPFSTLIRMESTSNGVEVCKIGIYPDISLFSQMLANYSNQNAGLIQSVPQSFIAQLFKDYLLGNMPFVSPILTDTFNWKYDFCFKAPAAFFESEVQQSLVPLVEGVSISAHYLGGPVREALPGQKETTKPSAYRFYHHSLDPSVRLRPENDDTQVFSFTDAVNEITNKATNIAVFNPVFQTEEGQNVLNNHVRITLNTRSKIENRDDSLAYLISRFSTKRLFMNFLMNNDMQLNTKERFVQFLDQSRLGGSENNKQVINYEPKSYEQAIVDESLVPHDSAANNFFEHYDFDSSTIFERITEETLFKSPIPYSIENYNFQVMMYEENHPESRDLSRLVSSYKKEKSRNFESILSGQPAKNEILAFRIEKSSIDGEVIQNFYFFNDYESEVLDFIDTQVFYNKEYTYKIYAINAVVGSKYKYSTLENSGNITRQNPFSFSVQTIPVLSLIETPYFEQQITMIDKPPMFPQVEVVPFFQEADRVGFRLTPTYGSIIEKPVQILVEDEIKILKMQNNSVNFSGEQEGPDRPVYYSSDNPPTEYEILLLDHAPTSYQDFSSAQRFVKQSNYNSGYMELNLEPNKKYYMIFRASDSAGISNPSAVYTLTLNSHVDGIYIQFDEYDMVPADLNEPMTFERVLKIDPSPEQMSVDFSEHIQQENFYASAPLVSELQLGVENLKVWDKDYKFRLISRTTGKAIDLNIKYDYLTIEPPPPFVLEDLVYDVATRTEEESDEFADALATAFAEFANSDNDTANLVDTSEVTNEGFEELDDSNTYDDEGGQRSRAPDQTETVRERFEREERERREQERLESMRREAASTRNLRTVYNYEN